MKRSLLAILLCFNSCTNTSTSQEQLPPETVLSKEEKIIRLYRETLIPVFEDFEGLEIPNDLIIDEKDSDINAGAAFAYIEISKGLVNLENEPIQLFALAHEVSHIATLAQARKFGLSGMLPKGTITNEYKKAEFLADLMALHLLSKKLPVEADRLKADFSTLQNVLGSERYTHPSGKERIDALKSYIQGVSEKGAEAFFKSLFLSLWNMD